MKQLKLIGLTILITFAIGLFFGTQWSSLSKNTTNDKKPLYWVDSMEPTVHYPGPGKSHMGMELTPVYEKELPEKDNNSIEISAVVENNLGVRTALVTEGAISRPIETIGYIEPNENNITHIHPYVDGWIRVLQVKTAGATVKKGDILFQLYSPSLINAEQEYLQTLQGNDQNLQEAGKGKLLSLGVSEQQIQQITATHKIDQLITTYSPQDGIVTELNVREGMRVTPDLEVMGLLNLSSVWMAADVFEDEAAWVEVGQTGLLGRRRRKQGKCSIVFHRSINHQICIQALRGLQTEAYLISCG